MEQDLVTIQFRRRAILVGGAMYLPGEIAGVSRQIAEELCAENDNPTAALYKAPDEPPLNKMVASPVNKKGRA